MLHCFLPWQCRIDTRTLARWMYNVFCIYGAPRGSFLPLASRHLIGYQLFLLLPQHDSDIYGLFSFYLGGNNFYAVPKRYPTSVQLFLHSSSPYDTFLYLVKSLTQQGLFAFSFADAPAGSYGVEYLCFSFPMDSLLWGQIIYMWLGCTFACRKAIRQRYSIFFFLSEAS